MIKQNASAPAAAERDAPVATPEVKNAPGIASKGPEFYVASHDVLFEGDQRVSCDACGAPIVDGDPDDGYGVQGSGLYLWARGEEIRHEEAPLCASCASAIGMTALARWEIEEEEG
jgi:hypothetical protein